ncbi:MAG: molybdopterin-dependent oxidoreductase [Chloroflexi bacterium]|nr:molybdopterin-dependent oxidoreductase [Chloroflexota bacterium]
MNKAIAFTLNGEAREVQVDPVRTLLQVLREDLDLTGTKQGCDGGECGSCTVILDGKAAMSCLLPMAQVEGRHVLTIEALGSPQNLHPLQQAFADLGAVQCGFCTPGMIMEAKALLDTTTNPTREEVVRRLSRNLCRCTGYVKIIDAVLYAARLMRGEPRHAPAPGPSLIGQRVERYGVRDKVCGRTKYAADIKLPGMLYAKVLRSPHHHARILSVDTREAEAVPGVAAVVTAKDVPGVNTQRPGSTGWTVLAEERAHFLGDAVAAVAAVSEEVAAQALSKIKVDYQPLPAVFDPFQALKEDAPRLGKEGNLDYTRRLVKGNIEAGFAQADVIVENTYSTTHQEHAYLEPDAALAFYDDEGRLTVYACTQMSHSSQEGIAALLGLPSEAVRVIPTSVGGGFGGKYSEPCWLIAALLTYQCRQPVRLVYTREEVFLTTKKRQPFYMRFKTGATREGKLVALKGEIVANGGAYPIGVPPTADLPTSVAVSTGPYFYPNVFTEGKSVTTNVPKAGPFRGLGGKQICWAIEAQMDMMAQKLGLDPLEFRLQNAYHLGSVTATGLTLTDSVGIVRTIEVARGYWQEWREELRAWRESNPDPHLKRGVGLGCMWKSLGGTTGETIHSFARLMEDGRVEIRVGFVDMGQGAFTVLAQIAAQEMGVPYESIVVIGGDTALTTLGGSGYSKTTYVGGNATREAVGKLRAVLLPVAAEMLEEGPENITLADGYLFSTKDPAQKLPLAAVAARCRGKGISLEFRGTHDPRQLFPIQPENDKMRVDPNTGQGPNSYLYCYQTQVAEVEVNAGSGEVRVVRVVSVDDVGRAINPSSLEGQIEGSIVMGLGFALKEAFVPGQTRRFKDYPIPTTQDVPAMTTLFIEDGVATGPFGAKGAGENNNVGTPAAIMNAIADALGTRLFQLPATPQQVLAALKGTSRSE